MHLGLNLFTEKNVCIVLFLAVLYSIKAFVLLLAAASLVGEHTGTEVVMHGLNFQPGIEPMSLALPVDHQGSPSSSYKDTKSYWVTAYPNYSQSEGCKNQITFK